MVSFDDDDEQGAVSTEQNLSLGELIESRVLLPIVSGTVLEDIVLRGRASLLDRYATFIKYPFPDRDELPKMARYRRLAKELVAHDLNREYLDRAARQALSAAEQAGIPQGKIDEAKAQASALTVSEFAARMGLPPFGDDDAVRPLEILANLDLPIFITTSPYTFIEAALRCADKEPQTEFCRWLPALDGIPSVFTPKQGSAPYEPTPDRPLVYHLYGLDKHAASLVLTEDDYLDFLVAVSQNRGKDVDPVHSQVKKALLSNSLLLVGFNLASWEFRILHQGLIKPNPPSKTFRRFCCLQLIPNPDEKKYYDTYLKDAEFVPYWKDFAAFCEEDLL